MGKRPRREKTRFIFILPVLILLFFQSCNNEKELKPEIKNIVVNLDVERFDKRFANASADSIPVLMREYPYLFPNQYEPSFWQEKITDTLQQSLEEEVQQVFPDFEQERENLERLFKHIKYYYPDTRIPKVVTVTSDVDYRNKVILNDSLLIVALDTYLGPEHKFYGGIQRYLVQNFDKTQIDVDVASAFATKVLGRRPQGRRFIDEMIFQGKRLYLMQQLLSLEEPYKVMSYSPEQWEWAKENEVNIWTYFVERELLFSTDSDLLGRFIIEAPFSKFYMELDNESPPRLGSYIGWQIVNAYADKNKADLHKILQSSTEEIFENANYKPRK